MVLAAHDVQKSHLRLHCEWSEPFSFLRSHCVPLNVDVASSVFDKITSESAPSPRPKSILYGGTPVEAWTVAMCARWHHSRLWSQPFDCVFFNQSLQLSESTHYTADGFNAKFEWKHCNAELRLYHFYCGSGFRLFAPACWDCQVFRHISASLSCC